MTTSTPPILIIKRGNAASHDIALMRKAGIAVLQVDDPKEVRYMDPPLAAKSRIMDLCFTLIDDMFKGNNSYIQQSDVKSRIVKMVIEDEKIARILPVQS